MELYQPDVVIHCAAERRPDNVENDKEGSVRLNVDSTKFLVRQCEKHESLMIYISTEYVFDGGIHTGIYPPYPVDAETRPVNHYGVTKRDGELEVINHCKATNANANVNVNAWIIRVPVLYALDCETLEESPSLIIANALKSDQPVKIDDWGQRSPTLVDDVARFINLLLQTQCLGGKTTGTTTVMDDNDGEPSLMEGAKILHFSSPTQCTKYDLVKLMADILNISHEHVSPDADAPRGAIRPKNTKLDCSATWKYIGLQEDEGLEEMFDFIPLRDGIRKALEPFRESFR